MGAVRFDPTTDEVSGPGGQVHLEPRVMDFAVFLAQRPGEVVTRGELIEAVWQGYPGAGQSLTNAASKVRQALDEAGGDREQLQTVPKRGYQLVGPVESVETSAKSLSGRRLAAAGVLGVAVLVLAALAAGLYWPSGEIKARPRLVVLPLENLGPETDRYLALGLTEEITTRLASVEDVDVISRTSAMQYADGDRSTPAIANELDVDYLLEGSVQWENETENEAGRIRITTQLVQAGDDTHLWAESYDRSLQDIFKVQEQIADAVVNELELELRSSKQRLHARPTDSIEAYDLYLAGRHLFNQRGQGDVEAHRRMIELFRRAVEIDPGFAPAWAGLADSYSVSQDWWLETYMDRETVATRALEAAHRAIELDPELAEAHASLGMALRRFANDYEQARVHLQEAIELNPGYLPAYQWLAGDYRRMGHMSDALPLLERAATLDPLNNIPVSWYARTLGAMGRFDEASAQLQSLLEYTPDAPQLHDGLFHEAFESGRFVQCHEWISRWTALYESPGNDGKPDCCGPTALYQRIRLEVTLGRFDAARYWLGELRETAPESTLLRTGAHFWLLNGTGEYKRFQMDADSFLELDLPTSLTNRALNAHGHASLLAGDVDSAIRSLESAGNWTSWRYQTESQGLLAYAYMQAGRPEATHDLASRTLALLEETESYGNRRPVVFFRQAVMLALLDRKEEALEALDRAYEWGWRHYHAVTFRPFLGQLMGNDPRYTAFIDRVLSNLETMRAAVASDNPKSKTSAP